MYSSLKADTIIALSTPPGVSALAVIRLSGKNAISIINQLFVNNNLAEVKPRTIHYGPLYSNTELIDDVIVSLFHSPHSYTGEDIVEITCHGSKFIIERIIMVCISLGARAAAPGEFSERAFLNGKLDLAQAEAVADLIASENKASHDAAITQLRGGFSKKLKELRNSLLEISALLELELDFSEEDVEFASRKTISMLLSDIQEELNKMIESFAMGNAIKEGVKVVIAGRPNAGKSTLLNALLSEEKAMVSEIAGTTRDFIEDVIFIDGFKVRFIDTAGLRDTSDQLESMGILRTMNKLKEADLILYIYDVNSLTENELSGDLSNLPNKPLLCVANKIDKYSGTPDSFHSDTLFISAKDGIHINDLKNIIIEKMNLHHSASDQALVTNIRHLEALQKTLAQVNKVESAMNEALTTELIAAEIRHALIYLGEITGEVTNDEVLGYIFGKFCIGK